jgi:hypothetical protein
MKICVLYGFPDRGSVVVGENLCPLLYISLEMTGHLHGARPVLRCLHGIGQLSEEKTLPLVMPNVEIVPFPQGMQGLLR